ncbi:MAG: glycosyltransferase family 4 protein [Ignavibacteriae bacterium]|nr:glycosyltransferase family 4 protein [Ignavibacteriota bacterium]
MHVVECLSHSTLGGGQSVILTLVRHLRRLHPELECTIMLPAGGVFVERFKSLGVNILERPLDQISLSSMREMKRTISRLAPDVIHSHGKGAGLYARMFSTPRAGMRRLHSYHGFHPPRSPLASVLYRMSEEFFLHRTDTIISVSESEATEIRRTFPRSAAKVRVIPNTVDADDLRSRCAGPLPSTLERFLDERKKSFIVAMVARNDAVKNYPLALQAAEIVLAASSNVSFVFVGIDSSLADYARLHQLHPHETLALDRLDDTTPLLHRCNALMLTSKKEGSPLVVQEAFSFGKPVVATDVEGIRDVVKHNGDGLLCTDADGIAAAIRTLASDLETYARLSRGASEAASRMNATDWAERYYHIYAHSRR